MNCATGPQQMTENIRFLCQNSKFHVSVIPNAGIPDNVGGHAVFRETPESFAPELLHFARDFGVSIVGGCCGTTPAHLKAVVEAVKDITPHTARSAYNAGMLFALYSTALQSGHLFSHRRRARQRFRLEEDARASECGGLGRTRFARARAGARGRARPRCERGLRRPRRRARHARACVATRDERATAAHARLDRVGEDGSGAATLRRQVHPQLDELRGRRAAFQESFRPRARVRRGRRRRHD